MQVKKLLAVIIVVALISGSFAPHTFAQTPVRKLGRGIANIFTGFLELPAGIADAAENEGYVAAVTYGVIKGLALSVLRTVVGAYETATFIIPIPWKYAPILEPEFMMGEENF